MDLHSGETIIYEGHPSWRSILDFYAKGLVVAILAGAIGWFALSHGAGIGVLVGVFALAVLVGLLKRIGTTFVISDERLHIRRGLFSKSIQQTQLERVQNVNTTQSLFERLLRVGTVDFDTAGTDDSDFVFNGVGSPAEVVAAVDKAQRELRQRAGTSPQV
jgi:uncharacterized membrane protein YdbT with pleckstrin-like domain